MAAKLDKSPTEYKNEVQKLNFEWTDKHASIYDRLKDELGEIPFAPLRLEVIQLANHFKLIDVQGAKSTGVDFMTYRNEATQKEIGTMLKEGTSIKDIKTELDNYIRVPSKSNYQVTDKHLELFEYFKQQNTNLKVDSLFTLVSELHFRDLVGKGKELEFTNGNKITRDDLVRIYARKSRD